MRPGGTLPGATLPGTTLPRKLPTGTLPGGTLPQVPCLAPLGTLPGDTLPGTLPGGTLPAIGFLPGGTLPSGLPGAGQFKGIAGGGAITHTIDWLPSSAARGTFLAQLVVIVTGPEGCRITRSPVVSFKVTAAPAFIPPSGVGGAPAATPTPEPEPPPPPPPLTGEAIAKGGRTIGLTLASDVARDPAAAKLAVLAALEIRPTSTAAALAVLTEFRGDFVKDLLASIAGKDIRTASKLLNDLVNESVDVGAQVLADASEDDPKLMASVIVDGAKLNLGAISSAVAGAADRRDISKLLEAAAVLDDGTTGRVFNTAILLAPGNVVAAIVRAAGHGRNVTAVQTALINGLGNDTEVLDVTQLFLNVNSWLPQDIPSRGELDLFSFLGLIWNCLRNSPAPITGILAKFAGLLPAARINVAELLDLPSGVPGLPAGRVVNSYLMLNAGGLLKRGHLGGRSYAVRGEELAGCQSGPRVVGPVQPFRRRQRRLAAGNRHASAERPTGRRTRRLLYRGDPRLLAVGHHRQHGGAGALSRARPEGPGVFHHPAQSGRVHGTHRPAHRRPQRSGCAGHSHADPDRNTAAASRIRAARCCRHTKSDGHADANADSDRDTAAAGDTQATGDRNTAAAGDTQATGDRGAGNPGGSGAGTCSSNSHARACGGSACA